MATRGHFAKFRGLKVSSKHSSLNQNYMEKMIVREPLMVEKNLHPEAKKRYNAMMEEPKPLKFKLHDWPLPEIKAKMDALQAIRDAKVAAGEAEVMPLAAQNFFMPLNKPLGTLETLPFDIERTHKGNLPVYTDTRAGGQRRVTVVRKLYGDVAIFKEELSKIVSNSPIEEMQGRLEISGFHT